MSQIRIKTCLNYVRYAEQTLFLQFTRYKLQTFLVTGQFKMKKHNNAHTHTHTQNFIKHHITSPTFQNGCQMSQHSDPFQYYILLGF